MQLKVIDSNTEIPVEQHFRIAAGPGAGKTHWLVNHIRYVLNHSKRMGNLKKIACITYTNVGAATILDRLDFIADRVDISTIHSFIYVNIVKPFASFIPAEYELNIARIDGHDDHIVSKKRIKDWVNQHPNVSQFSHPYSVSQLTNIPNNLEGLGRWLSSLHYVFEGDNLKLTADNSQAYYMDGSTRRNLGKTTCLDKLTSGLLDYKKVFWRKGVLHHDDVLFFGYLLLKNNPFILTVLRAKFPYFFVDEFQDTSPIQATLLKMIGEKETIIGVIGDKAQSIYSFQGASPIHFDQFTLPGLQNYLISDNRRSTDLIVKLLNHIRKDMEQKGIRQIPGVKPVMFVGDPDNSILEIIKLSGDGPIATLAWDNITANAMKRKMQSGLPPKDLIVELNVKDSNTERRSIILCCMQALELAKQKRFKEAIKELERNFRDLPKKDERKKNAFKCLSFLLKSYDKFKNESLFSFFTLVKTHVCRDVTNLVRGGILDYYNSYTYEQFAVCIKIVEDNSANRTIHKAKGDEFDRVLVVINDKSHLNFLLNPNLTTEQQRIFYVAVSRSRDLLYICVPELDTAHEATLDAIIDIKRL